MSLIKKYNVAGPRYTSYPTVPYWAEKAEENPSADQWLATLSQSLTEAKASGLGAALYLHVPFCRSLCTYCGCNTRITRNTAVSGPYVSSVLREWALYRERLGLRPGDFELTELHLGGGTPTFLGPGELKRLIGGILAEVRVLPDHELSIEADPRVTTREHLLALRDLGFKRLSLGIQDFDPKVQEAVHRVQSEQEVRTVTDAARELDFTSVNFDLIYGLPFQNLQSVETTLQAVERLRPDRIAFYAYAHVPWIKPGQRRFTEADLPAGDAKRALYELGRARLEAAGYREIGMDHFALVSDGLWKATESGTLHRNFMGYTARRVSPLLGLGVSSISDSWRAFVQNEKLLETYQARVDAGEIPIHRGHLLSDEDLAIRQHILALMTRFETEWETEAAPAYLARALSKLPELEADALVAVTAPADASRRHVRVTDSGRAFLRNVCMAFDARLDRRAPGTELFSRTV